MKDNKLTRRDFLKAAGATACGLSLTSCGESGDPYSIKKPPVSGDKGLYKGYEKWVASSCAMCPAGCGIKVRTVEGRAVKIEGNNECSLNKGGLGPKGQSGLQVLYDPDRIRNPLKRSGPRGSGKWQEISWDEGISEISKVLKKLRDNNKAHQLAVMCGHSKGSIVELWRRFCQTFGTPNFLDTTLTSEGSIKQAMFSAMGINDLPAYDSANASYILSLGAGLFDSTCHGIHFIRTISMAKRGQPGRRAKIVHAGATYSLTAIQSDEWIPVKPGTYDALALGIAYVLIKEELYDKKFIESSTYAFDKLSERIKKYTPENVEATTGVPPKDIVRIAHEMANYRPAIAIVDTNSTLTSNGLEIARSAIILNALLGSIDRPGGLLIQRDPPLLPWLEPALDEFAQKTTSEQITNNVELLPENIIKGKPYPLDALLLYYSNPLYARINPGRFHRAFEKIPLIVSFSPFMDESSFQSDIILPDHTYLERWEDVIPAPSVGHPLFGIRQPVVTPLYNTKHTGDVIIELAKSLGDTIQTAFPWNDFKEALLYRISGIYKTKSGSIVKEDEEEFLSSLFKNGYWESSEYKFEQWADIFKTSSGKFEFYSQNTAEQFSDTLEPKWHGDSSQYPFYFLLHKPITYAEGSGANLPWLQELGNVLRKTFWDSYLEINPETAHKKGIHDNESVRVESSAGHIQVRVKLFAGIPPNVVLMSLGHGHTQMGRFAKGIGKNPKEILVVNTESPGRIIPLCGTKVRIEKIKNGKDSR
ncbi:MAG: molybdopterin-dependent oxidoreductase [Planctomycetes bacterium]|nr:molybdopterin-dependent oxidoreductase [Planctomycetota bacterium]